MNNPIPDSFYEQPIVYALRACASGEFTTWTVARHEALSRWVNKYPNALAPAAAQYLDEQLREAARAQRERERCRRAPKLVLVHGGSEAPDNIDDAIPL
jgi:hypothetical protein